MKLYKLNYVIWFRFKIKKTVYLILCMIILELITK